MVLKDVAILTAKALLCGAAMRAMEWAGVESDESDESTPVQAKQEVEQVEIPAVSPLDITVPAGEDRTDFTEWWQEQELLRNVNPNSPHIDPDFDKILADTIVDGLGYDA